MGVPFADATDAAGDTLASDISRRFCDFNLHGTLALFGSGGFSRVLDLVGCFALALFGFDLGNVYICQGVLKNYGSFFFLLSTCLFLDSFLTQVSYVMKLILRNQYKLIKNIF